MNWKQIELGKDNRANVRFALIHFPGITNKEIAELLNLSVMAVGRHVKEIRKEWKCSN